PTYIGYIGSVEDANLLLDACIQGSLRQLSRRLRADEQEDLIKSGSTFVYNEALSNIKRWTDGRSWSPRYNLDGFLIYHEL
ncbi:gluconate transport inducer 1/Pac2, partial [Stachybotrys elegans]